MKKDRLIPLAIASVVLAPMFFMNSCANTTKAPSGGPKDTIPPALMWTHPAPGAVGVPVHGAKLSFGFDEYVKVKTATNIFLSPPTQKAPKSKISGKSVVVWFEEDLMPGTTYSLSFTDAIADNNEGNMFPGFTYVFSTGTQIDTMLLTGTVLDCNTQEPLKNMTVMLYKDHSDSAVFLHRPDAACKTDAWGWFCLPYIQDTLYRIYAVDDQNNDNIYQPETERIAFIDSLVRPVIAVNDTIPEMQSFEMSDTLGCKSRRSEYSLSIFKEKTSKQLISNYGRVADRAGFIKFMSQDAWIDSLWISGYPADRVISQFNLQQDSLEIWLNDRRKTPDTLHLWVNYRKTDSLGVLKPELEHIKLFQEGKVKKTAAQRRKELKHEDTICVYKFEGKGETVEQNGLSMEFSLPIINENFDSIRFTYINPKQKQFTGKFTVEQDSLNLRRYIIRPSLKLQTGFEYKFKVPHKAFRDINGFYSDSTEVKFSLPTDETLSTLTLNLTGVDRKIIVELLNEKKSQVVRQFIVDKNTDLVFPYLKEGKYCVRVTDDGNRNSMVDTGDLLQHRQPEPVRFYKLDKVDYISIMASADVSQAIDIQELFKQ